MSLVTLWTTKLKPWLAAHSPFGNAVAVQVVLYTMVIVFFLAMLTHCGKAKAADLDIMAGSTIVRGPTGVIGMNVRFPEVVANYATLSIGFDIIGQSLYGCMHNTLCNNNQAVVHAQVVAPLPSKFELGIGVAHLQHADSYNCGSIDFSLSIQRPVYRDSFLRYQHFSSAGTCSPNGGRDILMLGWRFK